MTFWTNIQNHITQLRNNIIHPFIKSLSEYINTLYYTNQLMAYAIGITALVAQHKIKPIIIAITVPSVAAVLFVFLILMKKYPSPKGTSMYSLKRGIFRTQLTIYGNIPSIIFISILSSICLVMSFETLLLYYAKTMAFEVHISIISTVATIAGITALKLWELIANIPIIQRIKSKLDQTSKPPPPDQTESHDAQPEAKECQANSPTADSTKNDEKAIDPNREHYKIVLHCCNYFIGFTINSLTVILALASAFSSTLSLVSVATILTSVTVLSLLTCGLIYIKHQDKIKNISRQDSFYEIPETGPNTLPSMEMINGVGIMVADDRAIADSGLTALSQIGMLNL